jgi:DNA-binding LacI/PurR family transcriptional regulator/anti-anti-sigma regulatory factor
MPDNHAIGVLVRQFEGNFLTDILQAAHHCANERGFRLLAFTCGPAEIVETGLASDQVDGWIVADQLDGVEKLAATGKPLLLISAASGDIPRVRPDNHGGVAMAIDHLVAQNRRRIAFFTYAVNEDFAERQDAYTAALQRHGIPYDPQLIVDLQSYEAPVAYVNATTAFDAGLQFDAAFCANDDLALGVMRALRERGRHIPQDVAVVGFDDTNAARFSVPPLSSVRQDHAAIGRVATSLMLDWIEHGKKPPRHTVSATYLVVRGSSFAGEHSAAREIADEPYDPQRWHAQLAHNLVQRMIYPLTLTEADRPEVIWPGVTTLVDALDATITGLEPPALPADLWSAALRQTRGGELMNSLVDLLHQASRKRIDAGAAATTERVTRWLLSCQRQMSFEEARAQNDRVEQESQFLYRERAVLNQLTAVARSVRQIDWLSPSYADWGALALWRNGADGLMADMIYTRRDGLQHAAAVVSPARFPALEWLSPEVRDNLDYHIKIAPIAANGRHWGYLAYAERAFISYTVTLHNRVAIIAAGLEREELFALLQQRQATLQQSYERERSLSETVRELGCPIIPLRRGVLLVPLIGTIDSTRATQVLEQVLAGISRERAERVLLDITGVPMVDTQVAAALLSVARAAELLGARMALVGIRPEIAQSIVGLGIDLQTITTHPTLAAALTWLDRRG